MENTQPPVPESKYAPLTYEEYLWLQNELKVIVHNLPTHLLSPFWNYCNKIRGERINQPCACPSSASHWGACVTTLKDFVKRFEDGE